MNRPKWEEYDQIPSFDGYLGRRDNYCDALENYVNYLEAKIEQAYTEGMNDQQYVQSTYPCSSTIDKN